MNYTEVGVASTGTLGGRRGPLKRARYRGSRRRETSILFVGDTHGNERWWRQSVEPLLFDARPNVVISVGDFGYWPSHPEGRRFLEAVESTVNAADVDMWFVDGNHEEHDSLQVSSRPIPVGRRLYHACRGARWRVGPVRLGSLGGAVSPNRKVLTAGWNWFPQEAICPADVDRLGIQPLDILVTHDAPTWCPLSGGIEMDAASSVAADRNRALVDLAVVATRPRLVVHGHWHVGYRLDRGPHAWELSVIGLGADDTETVSDAFAMISVKDRSLPRSIALSRILRRSTT